MRFKRFSALLLCLLLILPLCPAALAAGENAVKLSTPEDLQMLGTNPDGNYILTADIDMAGVDWVPAAFSGTLDGNGHSIYNLRVNTVGMTRANTVDGNDKVYDSVFAGLFSVLTDATVTGLTLRGEEIQVESAVHCFAGGIAGYVKNAVIENCAVLDTRITLVAACQPEESNPRTSCNAGVGGVAGFGTGRFQSCTVDVTLVFDDQCASTLRCEEFMGGIISCGNGDIHDCAVTIDGYDACRGYAHNGGLVGMFYLYDKGETAGTITGCAVDGAITFFEDNADRRAYCQPFVGELLTYTDMRECSQTFNRNELFDYTVRLYPEKCGSPSLVETRTEPNCDSWGYTTHSCTVCGNSWRDDFTPPVHSLGDWEITVAATFTDSGERQRRCTLCGQVVEREPIAPHTAGDWVLVREPDYGVDGLRQRFCTDCGQVLEEESIPGKIAAHTVILVPSLLSMAYKDTAVLSAEIYPQGADDSIVYYSSSDEKVATVDTDGTVHAVGRGSAVITALSADGQASAQCPVTVDFTPKQWAIKILLFGWIWY